MQNGTVFLKASNLTFGGPDPFSSQPLDIRTNVDEHPPARNGLFALLTDQITGRSGVLGIDVSRLQRFRDNDALFLDGLYPASLGLRVFCRSV
ncbi:MAG: hypothetical protein AAGF84_11615 [Planctomycetota bacterium]